MKLSELRELREAATPGPWFYDTYAGVHSTALAEQEADVTLIAKVHTGYDGTPPDASVADARLIALAPDLARLVEELGEALTRIRDEQVAVLTDTGSTHTSRHGHPATVIARTALAKLEALE